MKRPAVIIQRIGPYHRARLNALKHQAGQALALEVCAMDDTYAWEHQSTAKEFDRVTLFNTEADISHDRMRSGITKALDDYRPDLVAVPGWADPAALLALHWALRNQVPSVLMSDSRAEDAPRKAVAEFIKKLVVRSASSGLVAGQGHRDYLVSLGMNKDRIALGYDVVDNAHFAAGGDAARCDDTTRSRLQLPEAYFLVLARMVPKKNLLTLVEAYARYREAKLSQGDVPCDLVLVGDGPLKDDLRAHAKEAVHFRPFARYDETPALLGLARGLVLPSVVEQWGLVVNEAMAAGCPVLVSTRAGAAEIVRDGLSGFLADPDEDSLSKGLARLHAADVTKMGGAAQSDISAWAPDRFARALDELSGSAKPLSALKSRLAGPFLSTLARKTGH